MLQNTLEPTASLQRPRPERNLMIESLEIKDFRCFEHLAIGGFGTVNVVVGNNGAGKTSLLEAIFLALAGGPDVPLRLRLWRGLGSGMTIAMTRGSYEAIWQDLFYQMDQKRTIEIACRGTTENTRSLRIGYQPEATVAVPVAGNGSAVPGAQQLDTSLIVPIKFEWTDAAGHKYEFLPQITQTGQFVLGGIGFPSLSAFFSASFAAVTPASEPAGQFSELSKRNEDGKVRKELKAVYPQIRDLSVEMNAGAPMLYCKVPGVSDKVPVGLISSGMQKLLSILLGISSQPKGVILVDGIENGFYYKTMPAVWKAVLRFCQAFKAQVFASTHSRECLAATLDAMKGHEDKFRLIRVERKGADRFARVFKGKDFEAAMETDTEVR